MSAEKRGTYREFKENNYEGYYQLSYGVDAIGDGKEIRLTGRNIRRYTNKLAELGAEIKIRNDELLFTISKERMDDFNKTILIESDLKKYLWTLACNKNGVKGVSKDSPEYYKVKETFLELLKKS